MKLAYLVRLHALYDNPPPPCRVYHVCRTVLDEELGVPPSPATQELYERLIRSQEARIAPPRVAYSVFDLIGRVDEWQTLLEAWQLAATGKPGCVVLSGEAGIGKKRAWRKSWRIGSGSRGIQSPTLAAMPQLARWRTHR